MLCNRWGRNLLFFCALTIPTPGFSDNTHKEWEVNTTQQSIQIAAFGDFFNRFKEDLKKAKDQITGKSRNQENNEQVEQTDEQKASVKKPIPLYGLTRDQNKETQQLFTDLGYEPGVADGLPGNKTKEAIKAYQADQQLTVSGLPSLELLVHLRGKTKDSLNSKTNESMSFASSPLGNSSVEPSATFFDPQYVINVSPPAQHLGTDFPGSVGAEVYAPISGKVLINKTYVSDANNKYLVIIEEGSGIEHVLGHIDSSLKDGELLKKGDPVGKIVKAGTGPHVHWGVNKKGVLYAIGNDWGWGRAPKDSSKSQALDKGWIDPLLLMSTSNNQAVAEISATQKTNTAEENTRSSIDKLSNVDASQHASSTPSLPKAEKVSSWLSEPIVRDSIKRLTTNGEPRTVGSCKKAYGPIPGGDLHGLLYTTKISIESKDHIIAESSISKEKGLICLERDVNCKEVYYCASGEAELMLGSNPVKNVSRIDTSKYTRGVDNSPYFTSDEKLHDPQTGCQVFFVYHFNHELESLNLLGKEGGDEVISIRWSGACEGGFANGPGLLTWYNIDKDIVIFWLNLFLQSLGIPYVALGCCVG